MSLTHLHLTTQYLPTKKGKKPKKQKKKDLSIISYFHFTHQPYPILPTCKFRSRKCPRSIRSFRNL